MFHRPPTPTLFPYTTLFRSLRAADPEAPLNRHVAHDHQRVARQLLRIRVGADDERAVIEQHHVTDRLVGRRDRKSTRLNSSHTVTSYAVFCLKKKKRK